MNNFFKISVGIVSTLVSISFMFIPESLFARYNIFSNISNEMNIIVNRVLFLLEIIVISIILSVIYICIRKKVTIKGHNYIIQIEYGDIYKIKKCKRVINFDECFTTTIGDSPSDIKSTSICGQYILKNPDIDIDTLIANANLKPAKTNSKFQNKVRYNSGKLVPNGDDLLMAFVRLDRNGKGMFFSYQEFLDCLSTLWEEIDKYYAQKDVCIPILGAGLTRINGQSLNQQELLDIIIMSYKMNIYKIKKPYKLRIICKRNDGFSLNNIGESL